MAARSLLVGAVSNRFRPPVRYLFRSLASVPSSNKPEPVTSPSNASGKTQSWLTHTVKANPILYAVFLGLARALGYGSSKQLANRRALHLYNNLCATQADEEAHFWKECALPPTFQSWFTVTNLHVWLLTVRLRSLPAPHGLNHIQGLIDHFFQDVEERVRTVLQPGVLPPRSSVDSALTAPSPSFGSQHRLELGRYTSPYPNSSFYTFPSPVPPPDTFPSAAAYAKAEKRARAPERLVTRHMKIFKEQWAGLGMSMDLGLVKGDAEMAGAIWRNLLGGRGAGGISIPGAGIKDRSDVKDIHKPAFRRSVNLVGGLVENVEKIDIASEEAKDDLSGVYDFGDNESDRYITYPELMENLVIYVRREVQRLERLPDEVILGPRAVGREGEGVKKLMWGKVRP